MIGDFPSPASLLERRVHRPFPLPRVPWVMTQGWHELLFAHWPLPVDTVRPVVPAQLELEQFDGQAWVALTPFHLRELTLRQIPPPPGIPSEFLEMNLRTYVRREGIPGVYFFSLDAASRAAVVAARTLYRLPYFHAEMRMTPDGEGWRYESRRVNGDAEARLRYQALDHPFIAEPGTFEHWATERYCLYAPLESGKVLRAHIHHPPWTLRRAEADIEVNTVDRAAGLALPDTAPHLLYAEPQHVLAWAPELVG